MHTVKSVFDYLATIGTKERPVSIGRWSASLFATVIMIALFLYTPQIYSTCNFQPADYVFLTTVAFLLALLALFLLLGICRQVYSHL